MMMDTGQKWKDESSARKESPSVLVGEQGMTLIELAVGAVVAMLVVAGAYAVLTSSQKSTHANDQIVETQQNVRIAMDLLSRDIKNAGFGWAGPVPGPASTTCATPIVPLDKNPTGNDMGPDSIRLAVPIGSSIAPAWTLTNAVLGKVKITGVSMSAGAVANMATEAGGSLNGSVVTIAGASTVTVTGVTTSGSTSILNFASTLLPAYSIGIPVYLSQCVTYSIGTTAAACGGVGPCLLRNGVSVADGVEDIQFAYACDGCVATVNSGVADRIIDDQGGATGFDQADFITNNQWTLAPMTADKIRLVQITVVARQTDADLGLGEKQTTMTLSSAPLQVSDHNHAQGLFTAGDLTTMNPPYTQYRRRMLTRTVETRNQRS
ncbi:PilW family protein [Nitrospira sp. CMX1]